MLNLSIIKSFIMNILIYFLIITAVGYTTILAYLYFFQRNILYVPAREMVEPQNYGLHDTTQVHLEAKDGVVVTAWYTPPKKGVSDVMVYYHGNAGNLADRTQKLKSFLNTGVGLLALSYRGYGSSYGQPSEEGLYHDARAAISYLMSVGIEIKDIFLYGESLGSGVAVQMATEYEGIKAIILEAPYTSISAKGKERYPFIPVDYLLKDKFDSLSKIKSVKSPVLVFHGYLDEVMPIHHGRKILEAANEPKEARLFENKGHSDFDHDELARITYEFIRRYSGTNN